METLAGMRVLVVGAGKSGLAAAAFCAERGAAVEISDTRSAAEIGEAGWPVRGQDEEDGDGFDMLVQSPGVPLEAPIFERARRRGAAVIGELELSAPALQGRSIAVTGTNGKTTTTALTGHIFAHCGLPTVVGGNIGTPPTALAGRTTADGWNVLELSSFQLETVERFRAHIAVVLNITPDHLDRHGTMEKYIGAKARLLETQTAVDFAVLNAADAHCRALAGRTKATVVYFNLEAPSPDGVSAAGGQIWLGERALMPAGAVPIPGRHNLENVQAAAAAAWLAGLTRVHVSEAIQSFPGVEHRLEYVRERLGVKFYNDSKATNVDASEKAIVSFDSPLWIILGGKDKNSDYRPLARLLEGKAKGVLLIGAAAGIIRQHLSVENSSLPLIDCGTLDAAIRVAVESAVSGDIVLLSPACASFDQFDNFEHRGQVFKQLLAAL
jgi:UDP-N-acetylmuramoylalanine--D-glutamate ligase